MQCNTIDDSKPFALARPAHQFRLTLADPPLPPKSLTDRYRPRTLGTMVGQGLAVFRLQAFLEAPYSGAFIFEGPTGVGKTTAALALAAELGAVEFGGLEIVKSGTQDAEAVDTVQSPPSLPIPARDAIDWPSIAERYRQGEGLTALSRSIGVPASSIHGKLRTLGVQFNQRRGRA